jgi:hypothetical protein
VAEQQNLNLLLPLGATPQYEQLEESPSDKYNNETAMRSHRPATIADPIGRATALERNNAPKFPARTGG